MKFGVDVGEWDCVVDWNRVKVDFAIIRCGFGGNVLIQNDKYYERNITECEKNNIPYGVYLYSYATNGMQLDSEIEHVRAQLQRCSRKPFAAFLDMEDKSTVELGKNTLTNYALKFCNAIKNYLDATKIAEQGNVILKNS